MRYWLLLSIALAGCRERLALEPRHPAAECPAPVIPDGASAIDLAQPAPMPDAAPPDLAVPRDLSGVDLSGPDLAYVRVSIYEVLPLNPWRVGDEVTVLGRGFEHPSYTNGPYASLANSYATLIEKSDSRLRFKVPAITLPPNGAYLDLVVSNGVSTATHRVAVIPDVTPQGGHLELSWSGVDGTALNVGQPRLFQFRVRSALLREAALTLTPSAVNASVFLTVGGGFPATRLAPNDTFDATVRVTPRASGPVRVRLTAVADGIRGFVEVGDLVVGTAIDAPEFDTELFSAVQARTAVDDIAVVDGQHIVFLTARFQQAGTYDLSVVPSSAGWTVDPSDVGSFNVPAPNSRRDFWIQVTPEALPPTATTLTLRVQRQGSTKARTVRHRIFPAD